MDRMRPVHVRQKSKEAMAQAAASPSLASPMTATPLNLHARSGSAGLSNLKRPQNTATKAAAQRLAQVMSSQSVDEEEEDEDDLLYDYNPGSATASLGLAGGRAARPRPPSVRTSLDQPPSARAKSGGQIASSMGQPPPSAQSTTSGRPSQRRFVEQPSFARSALPGRSSQSINLVEQVQPPSARCTSGARSSQPTNTMEQPLSAHSTMVARPSQPIDTMEQPPSARSISAGRPSQSTNLVEQVQPPSAHSTSGAQSVQPINTMEQPPCAWSTSAGRSSQSTNLMEQVQPPSAHSTSSARSAQPTNIMEQPLSARSTSGGRPNLAVKTFPMVPPVVPLKLRPQASMISAETQLDNRKDKRLSLDMGSMKLRESGTQRSTSALQDELDMIQEENESILQKLRLTEERRDEAETRAKELEKQVANLGEDASLEAHVLSRKEAALQQREAALKVAAKTYGGRGDEIQTLRMEAEHARDEATSALDQLHEAESENKSLRTMTHRLILTHEEMEEVVLKRCWLAQFWSLCVRHGIHADIASARYKYWSSLAPHPVEVVLAAGHKAKAENSSADTDGEERENVLQDFNELSAERNIESMLLVEKGLRELSLLKVEEAVAITMAQHRQSTSTKYGLTDDLKLPTEGHNFAEVFELNQEESQDVLFKRSWLMYFWRRAKHHGIETDIAEERLNFWRNHDNQSPNSSDAVDVARGLLELRKLGIENQLWSSRLQDKNVSSLTSGFS